MQAPNRDGCSSGEAGTKCLLVGKPRDGDSPSNYLHKLLCAKYELDNATHGFEEFRAETAALAVLVLNANVVKERERIVGRTSDYSKEPDFTMGVALNVKGEKRWCELEARDNEKENEIQQWNCRGSQIQG